MATERDRMRKDMANHASDAGPLSRRLNAIAVYLRHFENPAFALGSWVTRPSENEPTYTLSRLGMDFLEYCYDNGWVQGFHWSAWRGTAECKRLMTDLTAIAEATPVDLSRALTVLLREHRIIQGSLGAAYDRGLLTAIARRATALRADPPGENEETDWVTWWGLPYADRMMFDGSPA